MQSLWTVISNGHQLYDFPAQSFPGIFTYRFKDLSAAVDVYSEWIDACDTVAKENADGDQTRVVSYRGMDRTARANRASGIDAEQDMDDELVQEGMAGEDLDE